MWSEEEMRWIEPDAPPRRPGAVRAISGLRAELIGRNLTRAKPGVDELTRGASVVYAPSSVESHGNFVDASYRRIIANPQWARRLSKAHSAKRQARQMGPDEEVRAWRELDCSTSSDALLMNVFCYPRVWTARLRALLGVEAKTVPEFGVMAGAPLHRALRDRTELDMRVGDLLVEAKLTESDFQWGPMRLLDRYRDFDTVFEREQLELTRRGVRSYQLIRSVLAAHALNARFCVLCDARRPDLREAWYQVIRAVRSRELQARLRMVTWQEVAGCVPGPLREFLAAKYGIQAG